MGSSSDATPTCDFPIVCLAASAGGLGAYKDILGQIPARTGMAFIIVSHRGLDHVRLFPSLLERVSAMPVTDIEDGIVLEPNQVFVALPQTQITTDGIVLYSRTAARRSLGWPVNISAFLFSLAKTCKARSVAVILSGMGHDGSDALSSIKARGGLVFAQSDAAYESMPDSAHDTGNVDHMLTAVGIGRHLAGMNRDLTIRLG